MPNMSVAANALEFLGKICIVRSRFCMHMSVCISAWYQEYSVPIQFQPVGTRWLSFEYRRCDVYTPISIPPGGRGRGGMR